METKKEVFAYGICFKKIFWIFIFGCLFGCVMEMVIHFIKYNTWVSRSALVYGPLNPVYGIGCALFTIFLCKQKKAIWIFIGGAFLGGGVEYICSLTQELIFNAVSWDYSNHFLNLGGRTSLFYMVCWGFLALFYVKIVYPLLSKWIEKIPIKTGNIITIIAIIFIIIDCIISIIACYRWEERKQAKPANNSVDIFLDKAYPDNRLSEIYENAKNV